MTLAYLYDVVKAIVAQLADGPPPRLETPLFAQQPAAVAEAVRAVAPPGHLMSWRALMGRLGRLKRLGVFDSPNAQPLDYSEMLRPGRVSIIDVSDTDSPQVNNLVIAELLRGLQRQQDRNYRLAQRRGEAPTPVILFIEEAHEFLSRERIARMPVLFQQVARLARRGRKRWLGLVFVTQLPQHLPDEVLGLVNNWVLHKVNDAAVVARLRRSIGGIDDALWGRLPNLAPGQAILSFTSLGRPLLAAIDPAPCKLRMTD
jgi:DNA helicase HerA-like ATPase